MSEKFDVFLSGHLAGDKTLSEVINNLAALFKVSPERASALLSQAPVVIKGSIDSASCEKYRAAVERAGARCRIEPVPKPELSIGILPAGKSRSITPSATAPVAVQAALPFFDKQTVEPSPAADLLVRRREQKELGPAILTADESVRFEGSVIRQAVASFPNFLKASTGRVPSNFYCYVTDRRLLLFSEDKLFLELPGSEIQSITKVKLGSTIWHGANETTLTFADKRRGEAALARLIDPSLGDMPAAAAKKSVALPTVSAGWLIALAPLVGVAINEALIAFLSVRIIMLWYGISVVLAFIDKQVNQAKGHEARTSSLRYPFVVPWYLFARARVFGHGKGYSVIGSGLFAIALFLEIVHFYYRFTRAC